MKLQTCLMIRCIAINTINMQELLLTLKKHINLYFPHATIHLEVNESYWKYPECNEIIYNLLNDHFVTVTEFTKYFSLSWHHINSNKEEEAIWSQNCHPEEKFLIPEIEWVQIYTWKKNEEQTVN